MAIELYTGFVGSGKSFNATRTGIQVAEAPLNNRYVVANFPIKKRKKLFSFLYKGDKKYFNTRWIYKDNDELTVQYLVKKSLEMGWNKKEGSALLIFDEASIPFNSRNFKTADRMDWIKFLTQSRKFGYDIIFITQDSRMLDKQIRALCEYEVVHKKMNNMFAFKFLPFTLFACIRYWNGVNARYGKGTLSLAIYRKKIANRYDTLRIFDNSDEEEKRSGHKGSGSAGGSLGPAALEHSSK